LFYKRDLYKSEHKIFKNYFR